MVESIFSGLVMFSSACLRWSKVHSNQTQCKSGVLQYLNWMLLHILLCYISERQLGRVGKCLNTFSASENDALWLSLYFLNLGAAFLPIKAVQSTNRIVLLKQYKN